MYDQVSGDSHLLRGLFLPTDEESFRGREPMISWRIWVRSLSSSIDLRRSIGFFLENSRFQMEFDRSLRDLLRERFRPCPTKAIAKQLISPGAVSMDQLPQIPTVARSVVWSFSRGQRFVQRPVSRGVVVRVDILALRDGVTCLCSFSLSR